MINNHIRMLPILFLTIVMFVAVIYLLGAANWGERHIKFNGIFVLLDQGKISRQVESLSEKHPNKYKFQLEVERMLGSERLIKRISIRYAWPNDVIINIDEVVPVAIVGEGELLTDDCRIISYPGGNKDGKFMHFDLGLSQEVDFTCHQVKKIIPHIGFNGIKNINILDNGNFRINFDETEYLITGRNVSLEIDRMKRISVALREKDMSISAVDLRYLSGGAILPL